MHVLFGNADITAIRNAFRQVVNRGLKVKISELDIPVNNPYASGFPQYSKLTQDAAEWQKQRYHDIVEAYLNTVPPAQRGGIVVWGLWDSESWLMSLPEYQGADDWPLLFSSPGPHGPFTPKPALRGFGNALMGR
jgi:endo-1,4-beta-xylanase